MDVAAAVSIAVAGACALWLIVEQMRRPQPMAVMRLVWPLTALYLSVLAVWAYYRLGGEDRSHAAMVSAPASERSGSPTPAQAALSASHCGAGCVAADLVTEFAIHASGFTLGGSTLWAEFALDLAAAWAVGVAFQYFAIRPMGHKTAAAALGAAVKADTLSIFAFQLGMYGWMAMVYFRFFPQPHLSFFGFRYWFMMQVAMICGFVTSLPVNYLLLRWKVKEPM